MIGLTAAGLVKGQPDTIGDLIDMMEEKFGRGSLTLGILRDHGENPKDQGENGDD